MLEIIDCHFYFPFVFLFQLDQFHQLSSFSSGLALKRPLSFLISLIQVSSLEQPLRMQEIDEMVSLIVFAQWLHNAFSMAFNILGNLLLVFDHLEITFHKVKLGVFVHPLQLDYLNLWVQLLRVTTRNVSQKLVNSYRLTILALQKFLTTLLLFLLEHLPLTSQIFTIFILYPFQNNLIVLSRLL